MDFSRADSLLMASSGRATSMSFLRRSVIFVSYVSCVALAHRASKEERVLHIACVVLRTPLALGNLIPFLHAVHADIAPLYLNDFVCCRSEEHTSELQSRENL